MDATPRPNGLADGVSRIGFRKWYERELLSGHAHMVLAVLAVIGLLGSFEALREGSGEQRAMNVVFVLVCAGVGLWALRRYLFLLTRAEDVANQASCEQCGEYGRFRVVPGAAAGSTDVCCHRCGHRWTISADA